LRVLSAKYRSGQFSNAALTNCDHFLLSAEVDLLLRCAWLWCWAQCAEWAQKLTFISSLPSQYWKFVTVTRAGS